MLFFISFCVFLLYFSYYSCVNVIVSYLTLLDLSESVCNFKLSNQVKYKENKINKNQFENQAILSHIHVEIEKKFL